MKRRVQAERSHLSEATWQRTAIAAVLALGGFLRLWNLASSDFNFDQAALANLAARFVATGTPPAQGMISSVGITNPPLAVYLVSLPVLFGRDPLIATGFVAVMNVLGVWGCYRLAKRYWGAWPGVTAALLLAASPWAVYYSRKVWAQDLLLPGVILFVALVLRWLVDHRRWALAAAILTLAALVQIHFAAVSLAPMLGVLLAGAAVRRLRGRTALPLWQPLGVGTAAGMLLYVPYVLATVRSGRTALQALLNGSSQVRGFHWDTINLALLNIGGREIHALAGPQQYQRFLAGIVNLGYWPDRVEEALVVISVIYLAGRWWRNRADGGAFARDGVLLLWLATPVLFFLISRTPVYPHYLLPLSPAPYLALAIAAGDLMNRLRRGAVGSGTPRLQFARPALFATGGLLLALLIAWQGYLALAIYAFAGAQDTPGGLGTPLRVYRELGRVIAGHAERQQGLRVVALCPGQDPRWADPRWDECPAALAFVAGAKANLRYVNYLAETPAPPEDDTEFLFVVAPGADKAEQEIARFGERLAGDSVAVRRGAGEYHFFAVHNHFRDAAQHLATLGRIGDVVLLNAPGQHAVFDRFYPGPLPVAEIQTAGRDQASAVTQVAVLAKSYRRLFVVYRGSEAGDTQGALDTSLNANAYRALDVWRGDVRLALLATEPSPDAWETHAVGSDLGGQLRLVNVALAPGRASLAPGDIVAIRSDWQALRVPEADFTLFVQLLDPQNRVLAQRDVPLLDASRPTSAWQPGTRVTLRQGVLLPPGTGTGTYRLITGVYRSDLPAMPRLAGPGGDAIPIGQVEVR